MARINIGDIVRMKLPTDPMPDYFPPEVIPGVGVPAGVIVNLPKLPSLPPDVAAEFWSGQATGYNLVPGYTGSDDGIPWDDIQVRGGPDFVGHVPAGGIPVLRSARGGGGPASRTGGGINPWARTTIIPNSLLPDPIRRDRSIIDNDVWAGNHWDATMMREAHVWNWIAAHGGLETCCRIPELGAPIWSVPPWLEAPSNSREWNKMFSLPTANVSGGAPFDGTDTILGQYRIPIGYDGVISKIVFGFTGAGFNDFSGNIAWRVKVGARYVQDFGNFTSTFGDIKTTLIVPGRDTHRCISGLTISAIANIPVGSPVNGGVVFALIQGWEYPRR